MRYRAEIDGLRAVAVLPVIFFHAGFAPFSGGYVGVDVFFVISGYLITSLILDEMTNDSFSLAGFYDRRARRILPALFFVVACSIPVAWFMLLPKDLTEFFHSVMSVSLFSSNFLFWFQSGYFDTGAELKPLLHTWSLAVEEQFYIIFPLLLMALWRYGRRAVLWILFGLFAASLSYADWSAYNQPSAGFFLLPARGWELLIGAFAAFRLQGRTVRAPNLVSNLLSASGLIALVCSVMVFSEETPFPSVFALLPTVGTVLIILFAVPGTIVHRLLSLRVCVAIGLISYSMYLWHQLIFVFTRYLFGLPQGSYVFLVCVVVTILFALCSWRYVEQPFRKRKYKVSSVLGMSAAASFLILALGYFLPQMGNPAFDELDYQTHWKGWTTCYPFGTREEAGGGCKILNHKAAPTLAIIGDSHAGHLASGLRKKYGGSSENPIVLLSGGCFPANSRRTEFPRFMKCDQDFMDKAIAHVARDTGIRKVVISGYGNLELLGDQAYRAKEIDQVTLRIRQKHLLDGMREMLGTLTASGKKLRLISDNPEMIQHPAHCSLKSGKWFGLCPLHVSRTAVENRTEALKELIEEVKSFFPAMEVVDPMPVFCDEAYCYSGAQGENWYQNRHHLTPAGSVRLVEAAFQDF